MPGLYAATSARSVFSDHGGSEVIVQTDAGYAIAIDCGICLRCRDAGCRKSARSIHRVKGVIGAAEVDIKIFRLDRPVSPDLAFHTRTDGPAGFYDTHIVTTGKAVEGCAGCKNAGGDASCVRFYGQNLVENS
jgi:hypothetical protein